MLLIPLFLYLMRSYYTDQSAAFQESSCMLASEENGAVSLVVRDKEIVVGNNSLII